MIYQECFDLLLEKGLTVAFAESMTGGNLAHQITLINGASKVFVGGLVTYQTDSKMKLLDIDQTLIDQESVVSQKVADLMALKLYEKLDADLSVSITGNAGPSFEKDTDQLVCYISIYDRKKHIRKHVFFKDDERVKNIDQATFEVYQLIKDYLLEH